MHAENTPHFLFDPDSRGSLYFKFANDRDITDEDIKRVLKNDPESHNDPRMLGILIASQLGQFRKKKGRPKVKDSVAYKGRILWLTNEVEKRTIKIRKARKSMSAIEKKALKEPKAQAADEIAREYKLTIDGSSLVNEISTLKKNPLFGE